MPPKKRDKDAEATKNLRMDHIQADHELFLQAFEKPTQIYRFLRTRNMLSPIFLNRTLSYMRHRMSRNNTPRQTFHVDQLLDRVTGSGISTGGAKPAAGHVTITFLGFHDSSLTSAGNYRAQVETMVLKISHKKRKDSVSPLLQVSFGVTDVDVNPPLHDSALPLGGKPPMINIPTESFCSQQNGGHPFKSYMLLLRVQCYQLQHSDISTEIDQPAVKRRRSVGPAKLYGADLVVYDKHNRCLLTDADYELALSELSTNDSPTKVSPKKYSSWESIGPELTDDESCEPFADFRKSPTLKLRLRWSRIPQQSTNRSQKQIIKKNTSQPTERPQIIYQFLYNNNSRQQTEACDDLHCPWCSLDCGNLYPLLKHLRLCHARFTFTYVPLSGTASARIDVAINELYDGSYCGAPHALAGPRLQTGGSGPTRRAVVTRLLVARPHRSMRQQQNLTEFVLRNEEGERDARRPYLSGHARLYHHTGTCLPVWPQELECDSEAEHDPDWLRTKTKMMIDDFTDVNDGEKELMKLWNLHVMKDGFVGDCQIPLACTEFVKRCGRDIIDRNLYRNFVLHLCSLFDFGLISPVTLYEVVRKLQALS